MAGRDAHEVIHAAVNSRDLAGSQNVAARHAEAAEKARALEAQHREHEAMLSQVMGERNLWEQLSEGGRRLAVQADAELRRRYPDRKVPALESAEPTVPDQSLAQPGWLVELEEQRRVFRDQYEAWQNVQIPAEDPSWQDEGLLPSLDQTSRAPARSIKARVESRSSVQFLISAWRMSGLNCRAGMPLAPCRRSSALTSSAAAPRMIRSSQPMPESRIQANRTAASHTTRDRLACANSVVAPSPPSALPKVSMWS
jgi:hypothetical protein